MFLFRKSKPTLKEIMPKGYTDIHSHIIPGIDDGAQTTSDSKILLQKMKEFGFGKVIGTPHIISGIWDNSYESIVTTFEENSTIWKESTLEVTVAAEYMMDSEFALLLASKKLLTIKENYVLVEMSYINPPIQLYEILYDLQMAGYQPVLAHPERYVFYHNAPKEFTKLKNAGCLLQLNLLSLTGYYGNAEAKTADYLLKNNMYSFSGSDIHHVKHLESFDNKIVLSETDDIQKLLEKNCFFKT